MPFPLLRLPLLASINVIKNFSVTQIINLIQTFSKVQQLVKISKYPVRLYVCPESITLKNPMNPDKLEVLIVVHSGIKEHQEQIRFQKIHEQEVFTEWDDEMEGYKRIIEFLVENFTVKCISFKKRDNHCERFLEYLEYSKSRGIKFDKVIVWDRSWKDGMADRLFSVCSNASEVELLLKSTRNFTFNGFHELRMNRLVLFLMGFEWFTVDHMCDLMNCSEVIVRNLTHWKAVDFNKLLKFWIQSTGRLRTVDLHSCDSVLNPEIVMNGIKKIKLDRNTTFQIQRDNGLKARVTVENFSFCLNVIDA
ncbi:unnamed protein product [Caenorhabditis brenneri]